MRSSTSLLFFAGSAAAQSSAAVFNLWEVASTLTLVGSDATATTYKNDCPTSNAGLVDLESQLPSSLQSALPTPTPTARALLVRQALSEDPNTDGASLCEPYTIKQGASTWEMHLTDPSPGLWTIDMNCNWQGAMTTADFTCTAKADGSYVDATDRTVQTTVMSAATVKDFDAINTVAIVAASQTAASQTPLSSGASGAAPTASRSGASGAGASGAGASGSPSGSAAPSPSTGFAPAGPLPTSAMALVGGAVGVLAAALAL